MTKPIDHAWAVLKQAGVDFNFDDSRLQPPQPAPPVSQQSSAFPNQNTLEAWGVPATTMYGPQPNPNPPPPAITQPWWARPYSSKKPDWRTGVGGAVLAGRWLGGKLGIGNPIKPFLTGRQREAAGSNMLEPHYPGDE